MLAILQQAPAAREQTGSITLPARLFDTLRALCDHIVPADERSGSASDAGVPFFLDFLASQSAEYKYRLLGGLTWFNTHARRTFGEVFINCTYDQQLAILKAVAFRRNGENNLTLVPGITFFAWLRPLALSAFFTSPIGITDLQYMGNQLRGEWKGCPTLPELGETSAAAIHEN